MYVDMGMFVKVKDENTGCIVLINLHKVVKIIKWGDESVIIYLTDESFVRINQEAYNNLINHIETISL